MKHPVSELQDQMVKWRRDLHQIPELGNELPKTSAYVRAVLDDLGIPYKTLMNGNAIVGFIEGNRPGKVIALRADMDGLKIKEETGLPFASTNDCMHACGHDGHTAVLLGVAAYLAKNHDFPGGVKLLFQPGEEFPGGAEPMIQEGALLDPEVDAIFAIHQGALSNEIPFGKVGFKKGAMMAAMDRFLIQINGKGSHGAYPEESIDPITIAAELILALQTLVSREKPAVEPVVISVTRHHGGVSHNIIPDSVEIEGTMRTVNQEVREYMARRIEELANFITGSRGATAKVMIEFKYPPLVNNDEFTDLAMASAKKLSEDFAVEMKYPAMGGEDLAYFLQAVPGTYAYLTNPSKRLGQIYAHHNSRFDLDETYFTHAAALMIQVVVDYLNQ